MSLLSTDKANRSEYAIARARDIAFDAVIGLWRRRRDAGMQQKELATSLGRGKGWVSKQLRGPGNWTLRTIAELVEAMDGEIEIHVFPREVPATVSNSDAYSGYGHLPPATLVSEPRNSVSASTVTIHPSPQPFELARA